MVVSRRLCCCLTLIATLGCSDDETSASSSSPATTGTSTSTGADTETGGDEQSPSPADDSSVLLRVVDADGAGIPKAAVTIEGATHFADNAGFYYFGAPPGQDLLARVDAPGHTSAVVEVGLSDSLHAYEEVQLLELSDPIPFDADLGGTVALGGTSVTFPPGALINRFGEFVTGEVEVTITTLDPSDPEQLAAAPGPLEGVDANDQNVAVSSLAMAEISIWQDGHPLQLAQGQTALLTLDIPESLEPGLEPGQAIDGWSLDLDTGSWRHEGLGTLEQVDDNLVWTIEVGHFSWWDVDHPIDWVDFECFYVIIEDEEGEPLTHSFKLWSSYNGLFVDGGHSSPADTNVYSNCAVAPIDATPGVILPHADSYQVSPSPITGKDQPGLCWVDGAPNPNCAELRVVIDSSQSVCTPGAFISCPYPEQWAEYEGIGACEAGKNYCIEGGSAWSGCDGQFTPLIGDSEKPVEDCQTPYDDDCDGTVEDVDAINCECSPGETIQCYGGPLETINIGACVPGIRQCVGGNFSDVCDDEVTPTAEDCGSPQDAQTDLDCDGVATCDTPEPPQELQLAASPIKQFDLSWSPMPGAGYYQVLERPYLDSPEYVQIGPDVSDPFYSFSVPLHLRLGASYAVRACNDYDPPCSDPSAPFDVNGNVNDGRGYFKASNTDAGDRFGASVAISSDGDTLAIGAPGESSDADGVDGDQDNNLAPSSGAVYIFVRTGPHEWEQQAYIKASHSEGGDSFGASVALSTDGSTLAVSATGEDSSSTEVDGDQLDNGAPSAGAVYVFTRDDMDVWEQRAYLKASNTDAGDSFGSSLALSADGSTVAVATTAEDSAETGVNPAGNDNTAANAGAAYVYAIDDMQKWVFQAYLKASDTESFDLFGQDIDINQDGAVLVVSAPNENPNLIGAAYAFMRDDFDVWSFSEKLTPPAPLEGDFFGDALALAPDGQTLIVGANHGEADGVYTLSVWQLNMQDLWDFDGEFAAGDGWQSQIALSGDGMALVVNGLVFSQGMQGWAPRGEIGFAESITLDGSADVLLVGDETDASASTGIGGDQNDNSAPSAGAVFMF